MRAALVRDKYHASTAYSSANLALFGAGHRFNTKHMIQRDAGKDCQVLERNLLLSNSKNVTLLFAVLHHSFGRAVLTAKRTLLRFS